MKKIIILVCAIMLIFPMVVNAAFSDLADTHWAASFINELASQKVISGYPDGTFRPNGTLTKGEYLKLLITASMPEANFNMVKKDFEHWAAGYVKVAENYNLIDVGEININNINNPINRIDVIRILSLADINIRGNQQRTVSILNFNDIGEITTSEEVLLSHAVATNVISGYPDGTFKPFNNLTRAEVAKILVSYLEK